MEEKIRVFRPVKDLRNVETKRWIKYNLSTMSKLDIKTVGPFILQETLGRGQTGTRRVQA